MSFLDVLNQQPVQQERHCYKVVVRMTAKSHPTDRRHPIGTLNMDTKEWKRRIPLPSRERNLIDECCSSHTEHWEKGAVVIFCDTGPLFLVKNSCNGNEQAIVAYFSSWHIGVYWPPCQSELLVLQSRHMSCPWKSTNRTLLALQHLWKYQHSRRGTM